jgi:hypothetical protein
VRTHGRVMVVGAPPPPLPTKLHHFPRPHESHKFFFFSSFCWFFLIQSSYSPTSLSLSLTSLWLLLLLLYFWRHYILIDPVYGTTWRNVSFFVYFQRKKLRKEKKNKKHPSRVLDDDERARDLDLIMEISAAEGRVCVCVKGGGGD